MNPLATLAFLAGLLSGCGGTSASLSTAASAQASGTVEGTVTLAPWQCAVGLPPPRGAGSCQDPNGYATTFAVATLGSEPGTPTYQLVSFITSDAAGHFQVSVPAGRYTFVSKYEITQKASDADGLSWSPAVFPVASGQTVTQNFVLQQAQPPISIGVGN